MRIDIDLNQIEDRPAFPHRGVMLDTARNFIPTSNIKEVKSNIISKTKLSIKGSKVARLHELILKACSQLLDSMSYSKLNVFHWHVTDSQVFSLVLIIFSLLDHLKYQMCKLRIL